MPRVAFLILLWAFAYFNPALGQGIQLDRPEEQYGPPADSTRPNKDSLALDIDDVKNIHREFDHREQVITASAFMGTLIFLMASMNNFNPKAKKWRWLI